VEKLYSFGILKKLSLILKLVAVYTLIFKETLAMEKSKHAYVIQDKLLQRKNEEAGLAGYTLGSLLLCRSDQI
jgi:hypothetical protein